MQTSFFMSAIMAVLAVVQWFAISDAVSTCRGRGAVAADICFGQLGSSFLIILVLAVGSAIAMCVGIVAMRIEEIRRGVAEIRGVTKATQDVVWRIPRSH